MPEPIIVLHGLDTIYEKIKDWLQERPIENDLMSVQVVLNGWPYVNMAYPLLEQALKALALELDTTYNPYNGYVRDTCKNRSQEGCVPIL